MPHKASGRAWLLTKTLSYGNVPLVPKKSTSNTKSLINLGSYHCYLKMPMVFLYVIHELYLFLPENICFR